MTRIGGGDTPGEVCGLICLDELVVHGWDIARASGQDYTRDQRLARRLARGARALPGAGQGGRRPAHRSARWSRCPTTPPLLDQVVAFTGRDPAWTPS